MRKALIVGNWKMNGSLSKNAELLNELSAAWKHNGDVEVGVCPPMVYLSQVQNLTLGSAIQLGAQDVSIAESGAYTGETSVGMLKDFDCQFVIVGHSERRQYHGETDEVVAAKAERALLEGITPIVCVGETLEQREAGDTLTVVSQQVQTVIERLGVARVAEIVVAYEPVWAIGTGLTATPDQAQAVHVAIRQQLGDAGVDVRIIYGGSVKSDNAAELFAEMDIDGALVGGASLKCEDFNGICKAAAG